MAVDPTPILLGTLGLVLIIRGPSINGWAHCHAAAAGENMGKKPSSILPVKVLADFRATAAIHPPEAALRASLPEAAR